LKQEFADLVVSNIGTHKPISEAISFKLHSEGKELKEDVSIEEDTGHFSCYTDITILLRQCFPRSVTYI